MAVVSELVEDLFMSTIESKAPEVLPSLSFVELMTVPYAHGLLGLSDDKARVERWEEEMYREGAAESVEGLRAQLQVLATMRAADPASPFLAQETKKLNDMTADLAFNMIVFAAVALRRSAQA